jgi:hypothetical protein
MKTVLAPTPEEVADATARRIATEERLAQAAEQQKKTEAAFHAAAAKLRSGNWQGDTRRELLERESVARGKYVLALQSYCRARDAAELARDEERKTLAAVESCRC